MTGGRPWRNLDPGQGWRGWWESGAAGAPALPLLALRGAAEGPTVAITGGVHGDEYEGPAAVHALFDLMGGAGLRGTLIGVPVVNVAAWEARTRVTPADGVNLNRVFPGEATAGATAALAEALFEGVVRSCDALVDLHSGGAALIHLPLVGWYAGATEGERLARSFDAALHPWIVPDVPGVLSYEAHRAGKVAVAAEWQGGARLDPAGAAAYTAGLRRLLANLGMTPPDTEAAGLPDPRQPIAGDYQETTVGGLFTPRVALGDRVEMGETLGTLRDPLGGVTGEARAARAGIVAGLPHMALLRPGDRVAYIG